LRKNTGTNRERFSNSAFEDLHIFDDFAIKITDCKIGIEKTQLSIPVIKFKTHSGIVVRSDSFGREAKAI